MNIRYLAAWAALGCAALIASPALAGSGNTIYLKQDSTPGGLGGNTIYVDQSGATGSQVGGFDPSSSPDLDVTDGAALYSGLSASVLHPALQEGHNNSAHVAVSDMLMNSDLITGGTTYLLQKNSGMGGIGNTATIAVKGSGLGAVYQTGDDNTANLEVSGVGTKGGIFQNGDRNFGGLTVSNGATATLIQNGNDNGRSLSVMGDGGSSVTYVVNGNNLAGPPASVVTNGASITITQTSTFTQP